MIVGKLIVIRTGSAVAVIAAITTTSTQFGGMLRFAFCHTVRRQVNNTTKRKTSLLIASVQSKSRHFTTHTRHAIVLVFFSFLSFFCYGTKSIK
jgi:hypothetical protein